MHPRQRLKTLRSLGISRRELLMVVAVAGAITLYTGDQVGQRLETARQKSVQSDFDRIASALQQYKLDNQHYPYAEQGLGALFTVSESDQASWNGPYLKRDKLLLDPWKRAYRYEVSHSPPAFRVETYGADGKKGGEGEDADRFIAFATGD